MLGAVFAGAGEPGALTGVLNPAWPLVAQMADMVGGEPKCEREHF